MTSLSILFVLSTAPDAFAIPPPYVFDRELAASPIIVVAHWINAPWKNNSQVEGNVLKVYEVATEIEVARVVKGDLTPGRYTILVGFGIGWSEKQPRVTSYTSTKVLGDASATQPNLWMLEWKRSINDGQEYLSLASYRGVQSLELEQYFMALGSNRFEAHVPELLKAKVEVVQLRALEQVAGGEPPWPYLPDRFIRPSPNRKPLVNQANHVQSLLGDTYGQAPRRMAAAVFAQLVGKQSLPQMRRLLEDKDPQVRAIAVGTLAQYNDLDVSDAMSQAVRGVDDGSVACQVISRLRACEDPRAVPILIEFLQNNRVAYIIGDDLGLPAIKAREALRSITGYSFPLDVATSRQAWSQVESIQDREQRNARLAQILPNPTKPWNAVFVRERQQPAVVITNRSEQTLTMARKPTYIDIRSYLGSGQSLATISEHTPVGQESFISLAPGESWRYMPDPQRLRLDPAADHHITLTYLENGNEFGVNAWLGIISVDIAD
ncbi:MAG: HEAT repeat domain-containing protein [Pirellulaceae bacterium]